MGVILKNNRYRSGEDKNFKINWISQKIEIKIVNYQLFFKHVR